MIALLLEDKCWSLERRLITGDAMRTITRLIVAAVILTLSNMPAIAENVINVTWRKAQVMSFGARVGGIVIADPSIVDVTLETGGQIIVFGKTPGETNIIITGRNNDVLFNAAVVVMPEDDRQVSIINAGSGTISERSWTCLTRCVQVLGPGGTNYSSLQPQGGGGAPAANNGAGANDPSVGAAAQQITQGTSGANSATMQGVSNAAANTAIIP